MPDFDHIELRKLIVGGKPVGYTKSTGTLHLAGDELTLEQWQELERRANLFFERAGLIKAPHKGNDPNAGTSRFLTVNLKQILARDEGLIKDPPWWLKGLFSGVITKEQLWRI